MRTRYAITTDVARVYKARSRGRHGWGWATATIREWPKGGSIDIQSDFGSFAYSWGAIGNRTLREFLCSLHFDYFMNKANPKGYRRFDAEATIRAIKSDLFSKVGRDADARRTACERRDDLDNEVGYHANESEFMHALRELDWFYEVYSDGYVPLRSMDCPQARAFWDGPWQALCTYWRQESSTEVIAA